jgi:predicted transcriptional regulator
MNKTQVYSWRLSSHLKRALEEAARRERTSVAALIERIVAGWLAEERAQNTEADAEQARLHEAAAGTLGVIRGGNPDRSTTVRQAVQARLTRYHAR